MPHKIENILALSHYNLGINRVFEDYCRGIDANAKNYYYCDYIELYAEKGKINAEQHILNLVENHQIDAIFFIWWSCDLTFDIYFIQKLSTKTKLVMNFFDTEYFFEGVDRYYAQCADLVILPDHLAKFKYQHLNINAYTSFALFDGDYYLKQSSRQQDIDVAFVGEMTRSDRLHHIQYLKDKGINIQAFGAGSENGFTTFNEMISIFNRAKINLNFTSVSNTNSYTIPLPSINQRIRQSKGRPIEIALCGGFILSQYAAGIEEMFLPDKEIVLFHSKEELISKIEYYLTHEEERKAIADAAYQKAIHTYEVKAGFKKIIEQLETSTTAKEFPIYIDKPFRKNYIAYRSFYLAILLSKRKFLTFLREVGLIFKYKTFSLRMSYFFFVRGILYVSREHPKMEVFLKSIKKRIPLKVKY